jgi:hypothetical protein
MTTTAASVGSLAASAQEKLAGNVALLLDHGLGDPAHQRESIG